MANLIDGLAIDTRIETLRYTPANLEQLEVVMKGIEVFGFTTRAVEL